VWRGFGEGRRRSARRGVEESSGKKVRKGKWETVWTFWPPVEKRLFLPRREGFTWKGSFIVEKGVLHKTKKR